MKRALPIEHIKQEVIKHWHTGGAIVGAPPGSGKTTQLPLWLLAESQNPIYLLIPKRLAVKLATQQLCKNARVQLGEEIGYVLRNDRHTGPNTRLIVTTYGSFLRMLLNEPDRISSSTVILDEFHERSAEQDLVYALINQYLDVFDDSVRRIIMSATLNVENISQQTQLPVVESDGFSFPIDIQYQPTDVNDARRVAQIIEQHARQSSHHILVFCAGLRDIRRLEQHLGQFPTLVLHGSLSKTPDLTGLEKGHPTIILATNIAESSVTLPNVHTVIDLGQERYAQTHAVTGMTELKTRRISQASATQRAGRAGRLGPGTAIRLWSEDAHQSLIPHQPAEIGQIDLTTLVLQTTYWGTSREELPWLDAPPEQRWRLAEAKLIQWTALTPNNGLSDHGKAMFQTGLDSWLAHLLSLAQQHYCLDAACVFAAHLMLNQPIQYDVFKDHSLNQFSSDIRKEAKLLATRLAHSLSNSIPAFDERVLAQALSDRLVHENETGKCRLISGTEVQTKSTLRSGWGLLLDGIRQGPKVLASQILEISESAALSATPIQELVLFSPKQKPEFSQVRRIGQILLSQKGIQPSADEKADAWLAYLAEQGEDGLQWSDDNLGVKSRWHIAQSVDESWPKWPTLQQWPGLVEPFLSGLKSLKDVPMNDVLRHALGHDYLRQLSQRLPDYWTAPSGRRIPLTYNSDPVKVIAELKLQECFGLASQPRVGFDLTIQLNLLAPNGRPVASVTDLPHFWANVYPEVRKELRGRYAKHPWPEDPISFQATQKTNRQLRADQ